MLHVIALARPRRPHHRRGSSKVQLQRTGVGTRTCRNQHLEYDRCAIMSRSRCIGRRVGRVQRARMWVTTDATPQARSQVDIRRAGRADCSRVANRMPQTKDSWCFRLRVPCPLVRRIAEALCASFGGVGVQHITPPHRKLLTGMALAIGCVSTLLRPGHVVETPLAAAIPQLMHEGVFASESAADGLASSFCVGRAVQMPPCVFLRSRIGAGMPCTYTCLWRYSCCIC